METLSELNRYNQFCLADVFKPLHLAISSQLSHTLTFHQQTQLNRSIITNQLQLLLNQLKEQPQWISFSVQFSNFVNVFAQIQKKLQNDCALLKNNIREMEEAQLRLQKCSIAWHGLQFKLFNHANAQLTKEDKKIDLCWEKIKKNKSEIEERKQYCFIRMCQFARELSSMSIKKKGSWQNDNETLVFFGKMSSEMRTQLDGNIPELQNDIFEQYQLIQEKQHQQFKHISQIVQSFYRAEEHKMNTLLDIAHIFNPHDTFLMSPLVPIKHEIKEVKIPKRGSFSNLDQMRKTVDVTLHPHVHNETIMAHRSSLSRVCSQIESCIYRQDKPMVIEVKQMTEQIHEYDLLKSFLAIFNQQFQQCEHITAEDIELLYQQVRDSFKYKQYRELFVFFLYQKTKRKEEGLNDKQQELALLLVNVCLKKCMDQFDSQTVIKLILVALHLTVQGQQQFFRKLDLSCILQNIQFWETTFIQNIYEYCQVMVNFYHIQLQKLKKEKIQTQKSFWDIFKPIQKLFKIKEIQNRSPASIQELYPQILKNVFTIYLALMKVLHTPERVQLRLMERIGVVIDTVNFTPEERAYLKEKLNKLKLRDENSMKALLLNKLLLQRALSQVIGPTENAEQKPDISSLHESITEWERSSV